MELAPQEPAQVTVTVFSARNLQSRRKGEVCHAHTIFGVGKDYYKTETVESNDPQWNQEALIPISGKLSGILKFKVRDKEHTIGMVSVNLSEITSRRNERWLPLQPHKKSQDAHGELRLDCWISEYRPLSHDKASPKVSPLSSRTSSIEDLHQGIGHKMNKKFSFHPRNPSWGKTKPDRHSLYESPSQERKGRQLTSTGSDYELHSRGVLKPFQSDTNIRTSLASSSQEGEMENLPEDTGSSQGEPENPLMPEITGISPNEGSIEGNQRVILRGSNLGESQSDVVRVVVADVDCTSTLEYFSPVKLVVTTLPRSSPSSGPVVVETKQGGVGTSSIMFTFVDPNAHKGPVVGTSDNHSHSPFVRKKTKTSLLEAEEQLAEMKALKQQVRDLKYDNSQLKEENQSLKDYIDRLLLGIIESRPEILEVKSTPSLRMGSRLSGDSFTH